MGDNWLSWSPEVNPNEGSSQKGLLKKRIFEKEEYQEWEKFGLKEFPSEEGDQTQG